VNNLPTERKEQARQLRFLQYRGFSTVSNVGMPSKTPPTKTAKSPLVFTNNPKTSVH
jgi:hypothetical protein